MPVLSMAQKAKAILDASQRRRSTPHIFAHKAQCSCVEDVTGAWKHIGSMAKVNFDVIIAASAQAIDFSMKSQECQSCSSVAAVNEILLKIYGKLVDLLQASIVTYTSSVPQLPSSEFPPTRAGSHPPPYTRSPPISEAVCIPSVMSLGEFGLDEQQSRYLALDIVCRTLRNFASVLQQMRQQGSEELNRLDGRVNAIFSRVIRLLNTASMALSGVP
jgi:hypothetical protein